MRSSIQKNVPPITVLSIAISILLFVFGCSTELGMNPAVQTEMSTSVEITDSHTGQSIPASAFRALELPTVKGRDVVDTECYAEVVIPRETGIRYVMPCHRAGVHVWTGLLVPANSITAPSSLTAPTDTQDDVTVSLNIAYENLITDVDLVFGPHGTTFNPPATFIVKVDGMDFTSIDFAGTLGFFYYRDDIDMWEQQDATINIDAASGQLYVNAALHHFSRYAVGFTN